MTNLSGLESGDFFEAPRPMVFADARSASGYFGMLRAITTNDLDLLSIWPEWSFTGKFQRVNLLFRRLFIAISPDAVKHVLIDNAANYPKSVVLDRSLKDVLGDGMFINNGPDWEWRRALAREAFTPDYVASVADIVPVVAEELVARWSKLPDGATVDVSQAMAAITLDIVCRGMFSVALGEARANEMVNAFAAYQAAAQPIDLAFLLRMPPWLKLPRPGTRAAAARVWAVLDSVLAERRKIRPERRDYFDFLMSGKDALRDQPLTPEQVRDEATFMLFAGHETTAACLAWAIYLVSQSPDVERILTDEIHRETGGALPTRQDVSRLPYVSAIVSEALRLYPPVALLAREAVGDDTIRKRRVPKGSLLIVPTWVLHRQLSQWRHPHAFRPERFLDPGERPDRMAFIPFSAGPRTCLGMAIAMIEATIVLGALFQRFRFSLPPGVTVRPVCRLTTKPDGGMRLILNRR